MAIFNDKPIGVKLPNGDVIYNLEMQVLKTKMILKICKMSRELYKLLA